MKRSHQRKRFAASRLPAPRLTIAFILVNISLISLLLQAPLAAHNTELTTTGSCWEPENAEAYFKRGGFYYEQEEYDKAIEDFSRSIKLAPDLAMSYTARGLAYYSKDQHDKAIEDFNQALHLDPESALTYGARGSAYLQKTEYAKAIESYSEGMRLDPDYANTYLLRGLAYACEGDYDKAIEDLSQAIIRMPNDGDPYHYRGRAYIEKEEFDKALADLSMAGSLKPEDPAIWHCRGEAHLYKEEFDKAIEDFSKCIEFGGETASAHVNRAIAYQEENAFDKAIADFNKAIGLGENDMWLYRNRGNAHFEKADYDQAIEDYTSALARCEMEDRRSLYDKRGKAYEATGEDDRAIEDYSRAKRLSSRPDYRPEYELLEKRCRTLVEDGEYEMALELDPALVSQLLSRGAGIDKAVEDLDLALSLNPDYELYPPERRRVLIDWYLYLLNLRCRASTYLEDTEVTIDFYSLLIFADWGNPAHLAARGDFCLEAESPIFRTIGWEDYELVGYYQGYPSMPVNYRSRPQHLQTQYNRDVLDHRLQAHIRNGDYDEALKLNPEYVYQFLYSRSLAQVENIINALGKALSFTLDGDSDFYCLDPDDNRLVELLKYRSELHLLTGEHNEAIEDLSELIHFGCLEERAWLFSRGWLYSLRGGIYWDVGNTAKAQADFDRSSEANIASQEGENAEHEINRQTGKIEKSPQDSSAWLDRANAYLKRAESHCAEDNDYQNAIRDFSQYFRLAGENTDVEAYLGRGEAYHRIGRESEALADFLKARERGYRPDAASPD